MKVALFVHCFFPDHYFGTETYTLELAQSLKALGHDPVIVTAIFAGEPSQEKIITNYEFEGLTVYRIDKNYYPYTRIKDTYYQPAIREHLQSLLSSIEPDIIHVTHLINHSAILLEVAGELRLPVVATFTDFFGICYNSQLRTSNGGLCKGPNRLRTNCLACRLKDEATFPNRSILLRIIPYVPWGFTLGGFILRVLFKLPKYQKGLIGGLVGDIIHRPNILCELYNTYRAIIAPTNFLKDVYIKNDIKGPIYEIKFGVDIDRAPKPERKKEIPIKFGYIGQIAPHKGTDLLVQAFCRLPHKIASLDIYGDERQCIAFTTKIKSESRGYPVFYKGTFPKENMGKILAEIDFLIIPSIWYENSPLVLLNALACHTPVIVSDVAGMAEFVVDGKNGYIFKRGNISELRRVMEKIVADPVKARSLSDTTNYQRTTMMVGREVEEIYKDILNC